MTGRWEQSDGQRGEFIAGWGPAISKFPQGTGRSPVRIVNSDDQWPGWYPVARLGMDFFVFLERHQN